MPRSKIEVYWNTAEIAPVGMIAQIRVTDGCGADYLLPYPGKLTRDGWVNATSGKPLVCQRDLLEALCRDPCEEEESGAEPNNHFASDGR
jgi:hypothetical protein